MSETLTEPIRAWRGWSILRPGYLYSGDTILLPKEKCEADCSLVTSDHLAPDIHCTCGFWAFTTKEKSLKEGQLFTGVVYGECYLWGKVIEHELGYRAQYMYPRALWIRSEKWMPLAPYISYLYGVPVELDTTTNYKEPDRSAAGPPLTASAALTTANLWKVLASDAPAELRRFARTQLRGRTMMEMKRHQRSLANLLKVVAQKRALIATLSSKIALLDNLKGKII